MQDFVIHATEQSLRFSTVEKWEDLTDKLKMQFSFNVGVMALGLDLSKEDGYSMLAKVCLGDIKMDEFHAHVRALVREHDVPMREENVTKAF